MNHWQGLTEQAADFGILEGYYLNSQHSTQMSFDNSMDDIDNFDSSPSPPGRRFTQNSNYYADPSLYDDDIMQLEMEQVHYQDQPYSAQTQYHYQDSALIQHGPVSHPSVGFNHRQPIINSQHLPSTSASAAHAHHYEEQQQQQFLPQSHGSQPTSRYQLPAAAIQYQYPQQPPESAPMRGSNPRNTHGTRLRPVSELPDMYRGMFKFGVFNAVQSTCYDVVLHTDENMETPTGSGKTVLFELSVIRMLMSGNGGKCVYMAPTKALCSERYRDWTAKFECLGIKCCELTGDTVQFGKSAWGEAQSASIIITTGEKWDSLTRNWRNHGEILSHIQLFLVDEVHILNESRGSTLEVVISRMKLRGSSVRFVFVSATVPNISDVAAWVGCGGMYPGGNGGARIFEFGEEFRPCKLTRHVYGSNRQKGQQDFMFAKSLDYKLFPVLQQHAVGKPILVFCATRKGVLTTAQHLAKEYEEAVKKRQSLPWTQPNHISHVFHDKQLAELAVTGIGIHHAGLSMDDRRAIEDLYLKKVLRIVIATSTLAVGVNLPAHMVVIKGVQTWHNNMSQEYSDLDIMQMLGRAGRPQFDKDGIAIILCESELESKYKALVQGKTILESCLHLNLSEHLNSEIGLGTITDISSAKEWLRNSFLYRRIQKNPRHYDLGLVKVGGDRMDGESWEGKMEELVTQSVEKLKETELVAYEGHGNGKLTSTEYGDIMSKFYIRQSTMSLILNLPPRATLPEILKMIAASEELSDVKLRASEKTIYNKIRQHNDIRFEVKKVEKTADKVFLLIQAVLGGISLNALEYRSSDSQPQMDAFSVFRHVSRIAKVVVEVAIVKKLGSQIKHGLELVRCLTAKAWEDRPVVLRQIEQIGEKSLKVLAEHGITTLEGLRDQDPLRIETLLNRRSPFGFEVLASANEFPQYSVSITETGVSSSGGDGPVEVELSIECSLAVEQSKAIKAKKQKGRISNMTAVLTLTSNMELVDFRRIPTKALKSPKTFEAIAQLTKPSQSVVVYMTSESIAGATISEVYKPKVNSREYPTMDTRPLSSLELDVQGFNEDPNFWTNMEADDCENSDIPIKDLTKPKGKVTATSKNSTTQAAAVPGSIDPVPPELKLRPDGNYECNHTCKDKLHCRHICCREGMPAPRGGPKKKKATENEQPKLNIQAGKLSSSHPKPKSQPRPDARFEELESLHERTKVSPQLPEGRVLKPPYRSQAPLRKTPNFDFELADIVDPVERTDTGIEHEEEDFPAPHELLNELDRKGGRLTAEATTPSETNYSNSEIDALIRDVPLVDFEDAYINSNYDNSARSGFRLPPKTPVKRQRFVDEKESNDVSWPVPSKRKAVEDPQTGSPPPKKKKQETTKTKTKTNNMPLFLPDSPDDRNSPVKTLPSPPLNDLSAKKPTKDDHEEFVLDYDLFDILPAVTPSTTSAPTASASSKFNNSSSSSSSSWNTSSTSISSMFMPDTPKMAVDEVNHRPLLSPVKVTPYGSHMHEEDDPLAELEAWLNSDAVILLPPK